MRTNTLSYLIFPIHSRYLSFQYLQALGFPEGNAFLTKQIVKLCEKKKFRKTYWQPQQLYSNITEQKIKLKLKIIYKACGLRH